MPENKQNNSFAALPEMPVFMPYAFLAAVVLLAYCNVYNNEFLFDDLKLIVGNKLLTSLHYIGTLFVTNHAQGTESPSAFYRPLQMVIYLIIYQITGLSTAAFHFLNVALHALNACLIYALGLRLNFRCVAAFLAALLWALHPVHSEVIAYVSGTAEPLCGMFLLAGIFVLANGFVSRRIWWACVLFILGLLSKETAVVFPLLAMGLVFYRGENRWSPKAYLKTWPFWLIAFLYFTVRFTFLNFSGFMEYYDTGAIATATAGDRFYTFLATLPVYLRLLIWPTNLHFIQNFSIYRSIWTVQTLAGLVILMAAFVCVVWRPSHRATPLAWGMLWAMAVHIPQSGILVPAESIILEHWLYLPTMGLFLGLGETLAQLFLHIRVQWLKTASAGFVATIAGLLCLLTFEQNNIWSDSITFYKHIIECGDDSVKVREGLGIAYAVQGKYELAIEQFRTALRLSDNNAEVHYNLGTALINDVQVSSDTGTAAVVRVDPKSSQLAEGVAHLKRAVELDPNDYKAYEALAYVYGFHFGDSKKESEYRAKAIAVREKTN